MHLTGGALFVLVAGSDGRVSRLVSAAWWDDPFRLAALAGVAGVPLAAIALDAGIRWAASHVRRSPGTRSLVAVTVAGLVAVARGGDRSRRAGHLLRWSRPRTAPSRC